MRDIEACRTEVLGGHVDVCPKCDYHRVAFNSCRNRHCPKCPAVVQARWIEKRTARLLPTHYFHAVLTLPPSLRPLVRRNREALFTLLLTTASKTLIELGEDPDRLGGQLGVTTVLHSWTRKLEFHPHAHCIVTGGGLDRSGLRWVPTSRKFLFPIDVLGALFRGKFLDGLRRLYQQGRLSLEDSCAPLENPAVFAKFVDDLYRTKWIVYSKPTFLGPDKVLRYLGRYTHRVALSNQRILAVDEHGVTFVTKGKKAITLPHDIFIGRFLQHVLPAGFVKIRHYGLHASANATTRLETARALLERQAPQPPSIQRSPAAAPALSWQDLLHTWTGIDPTRCPHCSTELYRIPLTARPLPPRPRDTS
jgi:hypothetical protein